MEIKWVEGTESPIYQDALAIRKTVFVEEQGVPMEEELDNKEDQSIHYVVYIDGQAVATTRTIHEGEGIHVQRVACLKEFRRQGHTKALILFAEEKEQTETHQRFWLGAQEAAIPFYEKLGYQVFGDPFEEAGIPHRFMEKYVD